MSKRTAAILFQGLALIMGYSILAACGSDDHVVELYSPDGKYHAKIQTCAALGSFTKDPGETMIAVLPSGKSENCSDDINSIAQFRISKPVDKPDIEWISNTELRAWDPEFERLHMPESYSYNENSPVKVVFSPKKSDTSSFQK